MAAVPGIKYDDGLPVYSANCFPVRTLIRTELEPEVDGEWLVAHRAEQRKRFKAILCTKPKTYARIKEERRRAEKQGTTISEQNIDDDDEDEEKQAPTLDGFFLMRHCCVEDPSDLCSVNISGQEISDVKEEDLALFDNVAYVSAGENYLPFEAFRGFPILRELEMPLNGLRSIKPNLGDYPTLEVLDLSYNNLSHEDLLTVGLLSNLKVLHLTGNGLNTLPTNLAMPHVDDKTKAENMRFSKLEILLLDDNNLEDVSVFAALAGLSRLKHLNLEKNELFYVPMLKSVEGKVIPNESEKDARKLRRSAEKSGRKSARGKRSKTNTPRHVDLLEKETTEVPKPTPVPPVVSDETTELSNLKSLDSTEKEQTDVQPDLLNEDLTDLSQQISDLDFEKEVGIDLETGGLQDSGETTLDDKKEQRGDGSSLPPFPQLRMLNLAYNKIEDEEALLAIAAWPMLMELVIHHNPLTMENSGDPLLLQIEDEEALLAIAAWPMLMELVIHHNPLTTENSGDPPLLQRFLGERLGIKITRVEKPEVVKPPVKVELKKSRHVTSVIPKIPKMNIDDLLMLEAPKPPSQSKPYTFSVTSVVPKIPKMNVDDLLMLEAPKPPSQPKPERTRSHLDKTQQGPLPPIPASPLGDPAGRRSSRQRSRSQQGEGMEEIEVEEDPAGRRGEKLDGDAFFMTQVDGQEEEEKERLKQQKKKAKKQKKEKKVADEKYKGYEALLDLEDDPSYKPPTDMHGNIKALKYALGHELVYRDPQAQLDRISKPVEPYRKAEQDLGPPRVTQHQKKERLLAEMKDRVTTEETGLDDVLYTRDKHLQRRFPDANRLLSEIQRRYNAVRVNSMKEAKQARKMLSGTMKDASKKQEPGTKHVKMEA